MIESINTHIVEIISKIEGLTVDQKIHEINEIKEALHNISPLKNEPVDFVRWVKCENVTANDYNPNSVAPPEMKLLEHSIEKDGYTQPVVTWPTDGKNTVVDGFHRTRVGKECKSVNTKIHGYLPVVEIRHEQTGKSDRIASTIRHNRARGKHQVDAMSDIILELKNRNWKNERIAKELGMDEDEILRLCQITGLEGLFSDSDFSNAWESDDTVSMDEYITDEMEYEGIEVRTVNTGDTNRIFHTYDKWECAKAGFYATKKEGMTKKDCEQAYADFLSNDDEFTKGLQGVLSEWKHSCEHYLTNTAMNRIAWMGQAAACFHIRMPSIYCSGFNLLTEQQKEHANNLALEYINKWMILNGRDELSINDALSLGRQISIY